MANQTISFRLTDEYQAIFNKLHEQACKANGSPISKVTFLEKVLDFYSSPKVKEIEVFRDTPETTAELEKLRKDYAEVSELSQSLTEEVESLQRKLSENNEKTTRLQSDYECLQRDYTSKQQEVNTLEKDLFTAENRSVLDFMKPFPARLLALTAERLSQKYNREVTPIQVLGDMFLRYTIEKWSEWFYPWVISEDEIVAIAHEINPEITNIKQVKQIITK
ncbi:MAG: hypothetical protein IKA83_06065 [Paludibacteraceae bacterium]|nr:hypothetical protein [Paludibacteraceae bacterium]